MKRILLVLLVSVFSVFTNCSAQHSMHQSSTLDGHDAPAELSVESRVPMGDRLFVESALNDVYGPHPSLDFVLNTEIRPAQHLYGRPCNPYESGDSLDCELIVGNASLGMAASSSSGREASRLQTCLWLSASEETLNVALSKVAGSASEPSALTAMEVVRHFYPAADETLVNEAVAALVTLDQRMVAAGETARDRWRLQLLAVCESVGWEML